MLVLSRRWNAALGQYVTVKTEMVTHLKSLIANYPALVTVAKKIGDMRVTLDTKQLYVWDGVAWQHQGTFDATDLMLFSTIQTIS